VKTNSSIPNTPPLGWNSYDCYGDVTDISAVERNLPIFLQRLKPAGFNYFVIDAGWYCDYPPVPGQKYPRGLYPGIENQVRLDDWGRPLPAKSSFPDGLRTLARKLHSEDLKFGVHLFRGVPRLAVERNLRIKNTDFLIKDAVDYNGNSPWCTLNYGLDTSSEAAAAYYRSVIELLAEWEVDFIKYDEIHRHPGDIDLVSQAVKNSPRPMVLSLSSGGMLRFDHLGHYQKGHMMRVTDDIWDNDDSIQRSFERMELVQGLARPGFWPDLDMIPFGGLTMWRDELPEDGYLEHLGTRRRSKFNPAQKRTFVTQRAIMLSPLMMGGDLVETTDFEFSLLTNRGMLECNQRGKDPRLEHFGYEVQVYAASHRENCHAGWLAFFNRTSKPQSISYQREEINLPRNISLRVENVWTDKSEIVEDDKLNISVPPNDCLFLKWERQ